MSESFRRSWCPAASVKRLTLAGLHWLDTAPPRWIPASRASPCDANPMRKALTEAEGGIAPTARHAAGATKCGPVSKVEPTCRWQNLIVYIIRSIHSVANPIQSSIAKTEREELKIKDKRLKDTCQQTWVKMRIIPWRNI